MPDGVLDLEILMSAITVASLLGGSSVVKRKVNSTHEWIEIVRCGLPAIASSATAAPDVLTAACGRVIPAGDLESLVETLRWFNAHRDQLPAMRSAAQSRAASFTWEKYRRCVSAAVASFA